MIRIKSARTHALAVVTNALATIVPQTLALLLLAPAEFGRYSLVYLVYAFGVSVSLSSISEAAARTGRASEQTPFDEPSYRAALTHLSLILGVAGAIVGALIARTPSFAVVAFFCVGLGTFRAAARYLEVATGRLRKAVWGDLVVTLLPGAVWGAAALAKMQFSALLGLAAWAIGLGSSLILTTLPRRGRWTALRDWYASHRGSILTLQGESLLMDVGALLTPVLLLPVLGVAGFGIYRSASNIAAPIRLILNPLRPVLSRVRPTTLLRSKFIWRGSLIAFLIGACVLAAFSMLEYTDIPLGTLSSLLPFAFPVALYVASNFIGHAAYIVARLNTSPLALFSMRWIQTSMVALLPLAGGFMGSLQGALWGLAASSALSSIGWILVLRRTRLGKTQDETVIGEFY